MNSNGYLNWVIRNTKTCWWHDSADPAELQFGLDHGAVGVTTNPFLTNVALEANRELWAEPIGEVLSRGLDKQAKAEALMHLVVTRATAMLRPQFEGVSGATGWVCAQVNPARAGDRGIMMEMARRFAAWAPNIAVKLPVTAAGLDVLEDCVAEGITCTATVSFTVPQAVAIAERQRKGAERARAKGIEPGRSFAVIMVGRLDDYLRDAAHDYEAGVDEADIQLAGLAATKRAYSIYQRKSYDAVLLVAALRGTHHMTELAGADLIMSIHPKYQEVLIGDSLPTEERIGCPVPPDAIERLQKLPEFVRSYDPDGMAEKDFIGFGATQRTLTQFYELGWRLLENFQ